MENLNIFRAYDIRGIYGKDINEKIMERIGKAFSQVIRRDAILGCDIRNTSLALAEAFMKGFILEGNEIEDIGKTPLGAALFHGWKNNKPVAYITASHLGKKWNGVKFFHSNGIGFLEKELDEIKKKFIEISKEETKAGKRKGSVRKLNRNDIINNYINFLHQKIKPKAKKKIILDCGNGATCLMATTLFGQTGFETISIFDKPEGNFPNRLPEPVPSELEELRKRIIEEEAACGIAYDGDGDRFALADNNGNFLSPEQTSSIIMFFLLETEKGPIVANVECSRLIDDLAEKFNCKVIRVPVGHTFLAEAVYKNKAALGFESSGHYLIPSLVPFDDAQAVSYYLACKLSEQNRKLSEIVKEIHLYPFERINFQCTDDKKFKVIEKLKEEFQKKYENVNTMDGVRVDLDMGWILIRASNTEPKIRLTIEGNNEAALEELKTEFVELLEEKLLLK